MDELSSELQRTLRALASAARAHAPESEEYAALALAARALLFLHHREALDDFRDWLASPAAGAPSSVPIHAFSSMSDALGWLEHQPEAATGSLVEVEHETYVIALGPTGTFVLVRTLAHEVPVGA